MIYLSQIKSGLNSKTENFIREPFLGFSKETIDFLRKLKNRKYNNKKWFDNNRDMYETFVKIPMRALIDTLYIELKKIDDNIIVGYKSIFRINRDIRFAKDKTPYKTQTSASFCYNTIKKSELPQFYFHLSPDEFLIAGGQYDKNPAILKKIRNEILRNFDEYKSIITDKRFVKEYKNIEGEKLKRFPKGYEILEKSRSEELLAESLKMKQYYVYKTYQPEVALKPDLTELITYHIGLMNPFMKFISRCL